MPPGKRCSTASPTRSRRPSRLSSMISSTSNTPPVLPAFRKAACFRTVTGLPYRRSAPGAMAASTAGFFRRRHSSHLLAAEKSPPEQLGNLPCLGLIQCILRQSLELGISTWAAMMEPQLLRMLASMGIRFMPVGPLVNHHGLRQPSLCHVPQMLNALSYERPENWAVVTNDGNLFYPA